MNFLDLRTGPINGAHLGNPAQNPDEAEPLMDVMMTPEQAAVPAELSSQIALPTSPAPESDDVPAHPDPSPAATTALADLRPGRRRRKQASEAETDPALHMRAPVTEPPTETSTDEEPEEITDVDQVKHDDNKPQRLIPSMMGKLRSVWPAKFKPRRAIVDFGTGYTLAFLEGGTYPEIMIEPTIVFGPKSNGRVDFSRITRFGHSAYSSWERSSGDYMAEWPMENGIISDTELMGPYMRWVLDELYRKNGLNRRRLLGQDEVVIGVHTKIKPSHKDNIVDCTYAYSGAGMVYVVDQVMAAAIGSNSNVMSPAGCIQFDIGDGTALVAIISDGDFIAEGQDFTKTAGRAFSLAIQEALSHDDKYQIDIGLPTAEEIKKKLGIAIKPTGPASKEKMEVRGLHRTRGIITVNVTAGFVYEALDQPLRIVSKKFGDTIRSIKPEQATMASSRGARLSGGSALLRQLAARLMQDLKIPVRNAPKPDHAVINGLIRASSNPILQKRVLRVHDNKKTVHAPSSR